MAAADPNGGHTRGGARTAARRLAYGGICTGLALAALLAVRFLPTADLALYALSSACVAIAVIETGMAGGAITWVAGSMLSLILAGIITAMPFVLFFGPYTLVKAMMESRPGRTFIRIVYKLVAADMLLAVTALVFLVFLDAQPSMLPVPWWAAALLAQPVLLVYDYALSMMITLYARRRHPAS